MSTMNKFDTSGELTDISVAQVAVKPESTTLQELLYRTALELLQSERRNTDDLRLLHEVFYNRIAEENLKQCLQIDNDLNQMFPSIQNLFKLHKDFLAKVELRMQHWEIHKRIGDVVKKYADHMKFYEDYVRKFKCAANLVSTWLDESPKFAAIVHEIQKLPICGNISLQHLMLEQVQRMPCYESLLKKYLSYLPDDSPDRQDAQDSLTIVTSIANCCKEALQNIVTPDDPCLMSGYLRIRESCVEEFKRRWFTLHKNFTMHFFRSPQDVVAYNSLHLPGLTVEAYENYVTEHVFCLRTQNKMYLFKADNDKIVKQWIHLLEKLVQSQLPDDFKSN